MRHLVLICCLLAPLAAAAEVYRWVDAQGKVHYTQTKPPKGGSYKEVPPAPPPGALGGGPNLGGYAQKLDNERADRREAQQLAQRQQQEREQKCKRARSEQSFIRDHEGRIYSSGEDGGRQHWTPEQHAAERSRLESLIAENCDE